MPRFFSMGVGLLVLFSYLLFYSFNPFLLDRFSKSVFDLMLRYSRRLPAHERVILVDIDEDSLAEFGQWPWPRFVIADLINKIGAAGASVIAMDMIFPEEDRSSPSSIRQIIRRYAHHEVNWQGLPEGWDNFDHLLATAMQSNRVVLGCFMDPSQQGTELRDNSAFSNRIYFHGYGDWRRYCPTAQRITLSLPLLSNAAQGNAFLNTVPDLDNIIRSSPLIWAFRDNRIYPSLALEAVRIAKGAPNIGITYDESGITSIQIGEKRIITDAQGSLLINFRQSWKEHSTNLSTYPVISAKQIMIGQSVPRDIISNAIVFVGTSAVGLRDLRATPLHAASAGMDIHATVADNLIRGDSLRTPRAAGILEAVLIILSGILLIFAIRTGIPWVGFLVFVLLIVIICASAWLLMDRWLIVFSPVRIAASLLLIYPIVTMIQYCEEAQKRRWVRQLFGSMVSPDVLVYLEKNHSQLVSKGTRIRASILFADIVSFTPIAETLPPERLSLLLNRLSPMTQLIMHRRGYVDKFEGDMIMAEWGVPFPSTDHAIQACLSALEMQERLQTLRYELEQEFGCVLHVRIGINTGLVTSGNMGSAERFQFTVIGDAVNQAARLETANKDYRTSILIGEETYQEARDHIDARLIDRVLMKGMTRPVLVYELMGLKHKLPIARKECARLYELAVYAHWQRQWAIALDFIEQALQWMPDDGPSSVMKARIVEYQRTPPPELGQDGYSQPTH